MPRLYSFPFRSRFFPDVSLKLSSCLFTVSSHFSSLDLESTLTLECTCTVCQETSPDLKSIGIVSTTSPGHVFTVTTPSLALTLLF